MALSKEVKLRMAMESRAANAASAPQKDTASTVQSEQEQPQKQKLRTDPWQATMVKPADKRFQTLEQEYREQEDAVKQFTEHVNLLRANYEKDRSQANADLLRKGREQLGVMLNSFIPKTQEYEWAKMYRTARDQRYEDYRKAVRSATDQALYQIKNPDQQGQELALIKQNENSAKEAERLVNLMYEYDRLTASPNSADPDSEESRRLAEIQKQYGSYEDIKKRYKTAVQDRDAAANQRQSMEIQKITVSNLEELASWPEEDQAALEEYVEAEQFAPSSFYYALKTDELRKKLGEKYGEETLDRIAESYRWQQNELETTKLRQDTAAAVKDNWLAATGHSLASVPAGIVGAVTSPLDYLGQTMSRTGQYPTLDPNAKGNLPNVYKSTVVSQVASDIKGDGESFGRNLASYLYQGTMTAADSGARLVVSGGNPAVYTALTALGSFGQTVSEASAQGASPEQAMALGTVNAGLEALTEKLPLDELLKTAKGGWKGLKPALAEAFKQAGIEIAEEELSLIGTTLAEAAILQEKSSYNLRIQELMAQGKTLEEATEQANWEVLGEAIDTAAISGFSGGLSSAGGSAIAYMGRDTGGAQAARKGTQTAQTRQAETSAAEPQAGAVVPETVKLSPVDAALQEYRQTGTVTNRAAMEILNDPEAVAQLAKEVELTLPDTASGKRSAVKAAVAALSKQLEVKEDAGMIAERIIRDQQKQGQQKQEPSPEERQQRTNEAIAEVLGVPKQETAETVDTTRRLNYDNAIEQGGTDYETGTDDYSGNGRNTQIDPQKQAAGSAENGGGNVRSGDQRGVSGGKGQRDVYTSDSEGRNVTQEQAELLRDTAIVDKNGAPIAVYHSTDNMGFDTFAKGDIGFHFGTQEQAAKRSGDKGSVKGRTFRAYLNIKNPVRASKDIMGWHPGGTALLLWSDGILTEDEMQDVTRLFKIGDGYDSEAASRLREILESKGYDGIVYPNSFEGDGVSYIAFRDDQIIRSEIREFGENAAMDHGAVGAAERNFSGAAGYQELLSDENAQRDRPGDVRPVEVPKKDAQGRNISEFTGNAYGSALTPDSFIPTIERLVMDGSLSRDVQTNEETLNAAAEALAKEGEIGKAMDRIRKVAQSGKSSAETVAEAMLLYSYLANDSTEESQKLAADVFVDMAQLATNSARSLQIFSLMRKMTTEGQVRAIQSILKNTVSDLIQSGNVKKGSEYTIDPELMEEFRKASEDLKRIEEAEQREAAARNRLDQAREVRKEADKEAERAERRADRTESKASEAEKTAQEAKDKAAERIESAENRQEAAKERTQEARKEAGQAERQAERAERKAEKWEQKQQDAEQDARKAEDRLKAARQRVEDAKNAIYMHAAAQLKCTFKAKWDAWRYMAMLGNVKTQVRNFFGNLSYMPYTELKRALGAAMELRISKDQRTKALVGFKGKDGQLRAWAKGDVKSDSVHKALEYSAKLGDDTTRSEIWDHVRVFKTEWLEKTREFVGEAPAKADMLFKENEYINAMAGFLKARGYTAEDVQNGRVSEDILNEGRTYAILEAMKATFNDCNKFSDALASLRYKGDNPYLKAISLMGEGIIPFRRTPANVVVRFVENSPVNILRSVWNFATKVRTGEMSAATAIDQMASGLGGTGMMALGYFLASGALGFFRLRGSSVGEDEEQQGYQDYAIEIKWGGKWYSYTIDWAAPANLPLFVGANFYDSLHGEYEDADMSVFTAILNAAMGSMEPLLALSCLSSLNDLFETGRYAEEGTAFYAVLAQMATSYFTQGIPALVRQTVQAFQSNQQETFANSSDPVIRELQRKAAGIPIVGELLGLKTDRIDAWGQEESKGGVGWQIFNAFFNPGTGRQIDDGALATEINRLNQAQPESVTPPDIPKTISYRDENGVYHNKQRLTEEEYTELRKVQGQTAYAILSKAVKSDDYKALTDAQKAKVFEYAYAYAREKGREAALEGYRIEDSWMIGISGNEAKGISGSEAETIINKAVTGAFTDAFDGLTDGWKNGWDVTGSVGTLRDAYSVYDHLSDEAQEALRENASGRVKDYLLAADAGVDAETFTELYRAYYALNNNSSLKPAVKAQKWSYELEKAADRGDITEAQKTVLKNNITISGGFTVETEKFDAMTESGIGTEDANQVISDLSGIEPEEGYSTVRPVQKLETIAQADYLSEQERIAVMQLYMDEEQAEKMDAIMEEIGISAEAYAALYRAYLPQDKKAEEIANYMALGYSRKEAENIYYLYHPKK